MTGKTDSIAVELLALKNERGLINPADAVKWARRNNNSRLHGMLDWNDTEAGEKWRIAQVRQLIAVHIVDATGSRRFVSLSIDRKHDGSNGYRPIDDVLERPDLREIMVADALAELERVQARYAFVTELAEVWAAAHTVRTTRKRKAAA